MILKRWLGMVWRVFDLAPGTVRRPGPAALRAYAAARGYGAGVGDGELEPRLRLLVRQLAAELAECRWCIERGRHAWRQAFLPQRDLAVLRHHAAASCFTPRERAALAFTEALAGYRDAAGGVAPAVLAELRAHFSEDGVAALTRLAAGEHFFDPARGALGADAGDGSDRATREGAATTVRAAAGMRHLW